MASYDKEKLLRMISRRRQAHVALLDLSDRLREARSDANTRRDRIYEKANDRYARSGHVDRLMRLSYEEASKLQADDIQSYSHQTGNTLVMRETGINAESYRKFIAAREKVKRLTDEHEAAAREFHSRYGVVPRLIAWVKENGFRDPELEAL